MSNNNTLFERFGFGTNNSTLVEDVKSDMLKLWEQEQAREAEILSKLVKEVVSPITGLTFGQTFKEALSPGGHPEVIFFPENTKDTTAKNALAAIHAAWSAFGLFRYGRKLVVDEHVSSFDPTLLRVQKVRDFKLNGEWKRYDWYDNQYMNSTPPKDTQYYRNWVAKRVELNALLRALEEGYRVHVYLMNEPVLNDWMRRKERFETMTVADARAAQAEDWTLAKTASNLRKTVANGKQGNNTVVDGIDIASVSKIVKIEYITPGVAKPVLMVLNPADKAAFQGQLERVKAVNAYKGATIHVVEQG